MLKLSERPESVIEQRFDAIRNRLWQDMLSHDSLHLEDLSGRVIGAWSIEKLIAREALSRFEASVPGSFLEGVAQCLVGLSLEKQGRTKEGNDLVIGSHVLMQKGGVPDPYPAVCRLKGH